MLHEEISTRQRWLLLPGKGRELNYVPGILHICSLKTAQKNQKNKRSYWSWVKIRQEEETVMVVTCPGSLVLMPALHCDKNDPAAGWMQVRTHIDYQH